MTDRDLRITELAGFVEDALGIPPGRARGLSIAEAVRAHDSTDPAVAAHGAALTGVSIEFQYEHWDRLYEVHVEPLRDAGQKIIGTIGTAVDITSRVNLEERAAVKEAKVADLQRRNISLLEATIESTADGLLVVDRANRVVAFNTQFLQLWRVPGEVAARGDDTELLRYVLDQLVEPEAFLARVREIYAAPGIEDLDTLEFKDGRVFERYSRPQTVGGAVIGRVWSFRDVTVRDRTLRHAVLLAEASRLLVSLDVGGALESVARLLVRKMWSASAIDLLENDVLVRKFAIVREGHDGALPEIPVPVVATHTVITALGDGELMQVPMLAGGRVVGMISVIDAPGRADRCHQHVLLEEIARRCAFAVENAQLYRRAQDHIRAREEFLAVASHEIRGPVASIRLAVEALRSGLGTPAKLVDLIDREERRLETLIDELLDLGRAQSGKLHVELERVDLAALVRGVVKRHAPEARRAGSSLEVRGGRELRGHWDRLRLDQVVTNLVRNAIKFGNGNPIEITVEQRDRAAVVVVSDHGVGIPADKLGMIFEPFERAVPARHYGGLGLGLYIVRTIVTLLGGSIAVTSIVNVGTTFTVALPREAPDV